ncbi:hypothetical protein DY245_29555 [Streptomyces inhibens]|uniref:Uncharacterized protein n=1 Tax=Streptomyces inhibens TaxID=2293571 RepID=A0A371PWV0_STRIH|nr:hypothetical protein DY245_29555 [Streptomyces inhibens]
MTTVAMAPPIDLNTSAMAVSMAILRRFARLSGEVPPCGGCDAAHRHAAQTKRMLPSIHSEARTAKLPPFSTPDGKRNHSATR